MDKTWPMDIVNRMDFRERYYLLQEEAAKKRSYKRKIRNNQMKLAI